jgi:hypothetical protein
LPVAAVIGTRFRDAVADFSHSTEKRCQKRQHHIEALPILTALARGIAENSNASRIPLPFLTTARESDAENGNG